MPTILFAQICYFYMLKYNKEKPFLDICHTTDTTKIQPEVKISDMSTMLQFPTSPYVILTSGHTRQNEGKIFQV